MWCFMCVNELKNLGRYKKSPNIRIFIKKDKRELFVPLYV